MGNRYAILDTNVLGTAANLLSPLWVSLRRLAMEGGITLTIPDIVLRESVNLRRSEYGEAATKFLEANAKIGRFWDLPSIYVPSEDEVATAWEAQLRDYFEVLPSEGDDALNALEREASRIPPARGGRGARDSLIWLTCVRVADAGGTAIFVSRNTKDFADRDGTALHPDLIAELSSLAGRVEYRNGLDGLIDLLATRTEGPDLRDEDRLRDMMMFELLNQGLSVLDFEERTSGEVPISTVTLRELRPLRAYAVGEKGLALVSCIVHIEMFDSNSAQTLRALVWVEFDHSSHTPTGVEIEQFNRI